MIRNQRLSRDLVILFLIACSNLSLIALICRLNRAPNVRLKLLGSREAWHVMLCTWLKALLCLRSRHENCAGVERLSFHRLMYEIADLHCEESVIKINYRTTFALLLTSNLSAMNIKSTQLSAFKISH